MKTIAAIATALAPGGVGIVRISGPDALPILRKLCPQFPTHPDSHHLYRCVVCPDEDVLDDVLAVFMRGPHSFTGDDVAEIHGHGGVVNMQRLLAVTLSAGANIAEPGEFTRRAFLNGRMDLTQAEAVIDVVNARSELALRLAQAQLAGSLGETVRGFREEVAEAITLTEAAIDFSTEEHVYQLDVKDLVERLDAVLTAVSQLLGTYDAGRRVREGVRVVFVGRPNAGKSTLFNSMCGHARAIVTPVPGTTRDYLEEVVELDGVPIALVDTAGLRASDDVVEKIGVERSLEQARGADLIVWVVDHSEPLGSVEDELSVLDAAQVIAVLNKSDLPAGLAQGDRDRIRGLAAHVAAAGMDEGGAAAATAVVVEEARRLMGPAGEGAVIARARHREALERSVEALRRARQASLDGLSHEFVALDLRLGLDALGEVVGHVSVDDVLHRIFAEFCVGK